MNIIKTLLSIVLFISLGFISCEEKENCEQDKDWGALQLSDTTKAFLKPYANKKYVFFKDSLGTEDKFEISSTSFLDDYYYEQDRTSSCSKTIIVKAKFPVEKIVLSSSNPKKDIEFYARAYLYSRFRFSNHEFLQVKTNDTPYIYSEAVIIDDKVVNNLVFKKKTVTIFGKTYQNVISTDNRCYIDREHGILAYRDVNKKLWVFDRFE